MHVKSQNLFVRQSNWKWMIVFSAFLLTFLTDGIRMSIGVIFKVLLETFGEDKGKTAAIGSVMFGVQNIVAPVTSVLVNKYGCRLTVLTGAVIYSAGFIASSITPNFYLLYIFFGVISGIGYSFMYFPTSVIILQYFDDKKSLANGIAMCGTGIGGFVFNPLVNSLFETYSFRGGILVLSGIMLNGAIAGSLMRPSRVNQAGSGELNERRNSEYVKEKNRLIAEDLNRKDNSNREFISKGSNRDKDIADVTDETLLAIMPYRDGRTNISESHKEINSLEELYELSNEASSLYDNKMKIVKLSEDCTYLDLNLHEIDQFQVANDFDVPLKAHKNVKDSNLAIEILRDNAALTISETSRIVKDTDDQYKNLLSTSDKLVAERIAKSQSKIFEWHILKDPKLILMMISQTLLALAFMIPFTYLPDVIITLGYSRSEAVWLMSSISVASTVSRLLSGYLADRRFINRQVLYCIANFVCALAVLSLFWCRSYELIIVASLIYGWTSGCLIAILVVVFSDMFGSRLLSNVYGMATFAGAPGQFIGPPLSGWIVDQTGRLDLVFLVSGATFLLATIAMVMSVRMKDRLRGS